MADLFHRYVESVDRLDALIAATPSASDRSRKAMRQRATERMDRLRHFLDFLGRPAERVPKVHIGGTSGKGSTTTALAAVLHAAGYRTGVHTSPYLQVPSEKLQWNGQLIEADRFVRLVDHLLAELERFPDADHITYGEAWIALVMLFLEDIRADIGIVEVGAGGRFDLTNIITPELAIITSVGLDHTNTLGDTIPDIAWHKAGIIKPGRPALSAVMDPPARQRIVDEAALVDASLTELDLDAGIARVETSSRGTSWRDLSTGAEWTTGMPGRFQARNGQTAVTAARMLRAQGWDIEDTAIRSGLLAARIPGRAEVMPGTPHTMLDGAHNGQKMAALAADLPALVPVDEKGRRIVVLGVLEAKHAEEMVRTLLPYMDTLVATSPQVLAKESKAADDLADAARAAGFGGPLHVAADPRDALALAQKLADAHRNDAVLVTGSLYLVGNTREHWYGSQAIIAQHTPWPSPALR